MPMVGTRRSTRVFVPKSVPAVAAEDEPVALVLRSGKRLLLSKPLEKKEEAEGYRGVEWLRLFRSSRDTAESTTAGRWGRGKEEEGETEGPEEGGAEQSNDGWDTPGDVPESSGAGPAHEENDSSRMASPAKKFKVAYSRKRKRQASADSTSSSVSLDDHKERSDRRYGITYFRMRPRNPFRQPQVPLSEEEAPPEEAVSAKTGDTADEKNCLDTTDAAVVLKERELLDTTDAAAALKEEELLLSAETVEAQSLSIEIVDCARAFSDRVGVPESDLWNGFTDHVVLLLLVDSPRGGSILDGFARFLLSVLTGMRRTKMKLDVFARFLLCKSFTAVFAQHGIHSLPLRKQSEPSSALSMSGTGVCRINGSLFSVPLLTLNFSALPRYFKYLHLNLLLGSRFISTSYPAPLDPVISSAPEMTDSPIPSSPNNVPDNIDNASLPVGPTATVTESVTTVKDPAVLVRIPNGLKIRRNQKRRSSLRSMRTRSSSWKSRKNHLTILTKNIAKVTSTAGASPCRQLVEGPITVEPVNCALDGLLSSGDADDLTAAALLTGKAKKSSPRIAEEKKSSPRNSDERTKEPTNGDEKKSLPRNGDERMKELKATLSDLKQNIDSVSCKASILVIESDRCWREGGAEVMLELGDSNEWHLAVKADGSNKYTYKATQDVKSSVTNRHTNALVWSGENSWKLEFSDRMDWCIFRELHKECYMRNTQETPVKIIPVPGVQEVSDYPETNGSFSRPEFYIKTTCDEDERALANPIPEYDMDSGDEEWLQNYNYNPSLCVSETSQSICMSEETFEQVIYAFEKESYQNPNAILSLDAALDLCVHLCGKDVVSAVFEYWVQKRRRKRAPLVRIFQEFLSKRAPAMDTCAKPILRKKRSFKRQGSQSGRGKPSFFLQVSAQQEQYRRVQEAEKEAVKAEVDAINLRGRAQILMENADLLTYRAVVALGLARAIREQESGPPDASTFSD